MIGISSDNSINSLNLIQKQLTEASTRLTSGKRVNSAADDAAGMAIISRLEALGKKFSLGTRNASDAISVAQVADGAMSGVQSGLQRLKELAVQSANGILSDTDRQTLAAEAEQIKSEIGRITEQTEFNGNRILRDAQDFSVQVGSGQGNQVAFATGSVADQLAAGGLADLDLSTQEGATAALSGIDDLLSTTNDTRSQYGALTNRLESAISNLYTRQEGSEASRSRIEDADYAQEIAKLNQSQLLQNAGIAVQSQANANAGQVLRLLN
jgi:flagellin